ncbi:MAG TPA: BatA domain-containing protein [Lysobacter sp.]
MNLVLLLPLGLAALAAWLIPLLIHLRRRSEQHRTDFAALRWLPARARPRSRLRFEEWPLLLVRLLLLAALALLLAKPVLFGGPHAKQWIVVAPQVDRAAVTAEAGGVERRWLAKGFPSIEEGAPESPQPVGSLLRELDATLPVDTKLTVLVPEQLVGADAERPALHRHVDWRVVDRAAIAGKTSGAQKATPRAHLVVRHDDSHAAAAPYFRAAEIAWRAVSSTAGADKAPAPDVAGTEQSLPAVDRPLVWLASGPLPDALQTWIRNGGTALVDVAATVPSNGQNPAPLWRDEQGNLLVSGMPLGRGRLLQLTKPLTPEAMPILLDAAFPDQLWALFAPAPPPPSRIAARDYAPTTGARAWPEQPTDLQSWLLLLIAGLFVIERWMASARREAVAP